MIKLLCEKAIRVSLLLIAFISLTSNACVIGPNAISDPNKIRFSLISDQDSFCDSCDIFGAGAVPEYQGQPFSHALLSVYKSSELVSKTLISSSSSSQMIEFAAIVSNASDVEYELVLEYGSGRCTSYQYIYSSKANTHNKSSKKDTASGASS